MKIGDRIPIKRTSNVRDSLPFDINGALASRMRIEAIGTVTSNLGNGKRVNVDWRPHQPRDWFFYTYVAPVVEAKLDDDFARRLILFTFTDAEQDYKFWINQPHWAKKYMGAELAD